MYYRIDKKTFIFMGIYVVYLITLILEITVLGQNELLCSVLSYIRYICYFFAITKILGDFYIKNHIFAVILVAALIMLSVVYSGDRTFIFYFLFLLAAKNIDTNKIIKATLIVQSFMLAFIISLSRVGILLDYLADVNTRARHCLGFEWANTAPFIYFFVMMCYAYLRKDHLRIWELIILEAINYGLYRVTDTKMSFYLSTVMLIYLGVMKYYWQNRVDKIKKNRILILAPTLICIFAIAIHVLYQPDNETWNSLNDLLSGRLKLGQEGMDKYGISLFGTSIQWIGFGINGTKGIYNYVDSSYIQVLLQYGIVFLCIVILLYTYIMYMAVKKKDFYLQTVILFILIFSITEPRLLHLAYNPFPFVAIGFWREVNNPYVALQERCSVICMIRFKMIQIGLKIRR